METKIIAFKRDKITLSYQLYDFIFLALLSALWSVIEIGIGFSLQAAKVPFTGSFLAAITVVMLIIGRSYVPKFGTAIIMGLLLAFLKFIHLGGAVMFAVIAILVEAVLVELALWKSKPTIFRSVLAGCLALSWSLIHPFFTQGLVSGWGITKVYTILVGRGAEIFGASNMTFTFSTLVFLHIIFGVCTGWFSIKMVRLLHNCIERTISTQVDLAKF